MIQVIGLVGSALALTGCWLNNKKRIACFGIWIVSNVVMAGLHCHAGLWALLLRDFGFTVLAVHGWYEWKKVESGKKKKKA